MIFNSKIAQFSIIELPIAFLLFSSAIYFFVDFNVDTSNYNLDLPVESMLSNLVQNSTFTFLVLNENLSQSLVLGNWDSINNTLSSKFLNFDLEIISSLNKKKIFNCTTDSNKIIYSNFVYIYNESLYDFREVRLGVCR